MIFSYHSLLLIRPFQNVGAGLPQPTNSSNKTQPGEGLNQKLSVLGHTLRSCYLEVVWPGVTNFTSPSLHFPKHSSLAYQNNDILSHVGLTLVATKASFFMQRSLSVHTTMSSMSQFYKPGAFTSMLHIVSWREKQIHRLDLGTWKDLVHLSWVLRASEAPWSQRKVIDLSFSPKLRGCSLCQTKIK